MKRKKPLYWMQLPVATFLADTAHLSAHQCGAYIRLLCSMWHSADGTLPDDDAVLSRVSSVHPRQWKRTWAAIKSLFDIDAGRVTSVDLQAERGKANAISVARRAAGTLGGQTTQFKNSLTGFKRHPFRAKKPVQNNGGHQANAPHNYSYNIKEEGSVSPRPETGEPSPEKRASSKEVVVNLRPSPTTSEPVEGQPSRLTDALESLGRGVRERGGCE